MKSLRITKRHTFLTLLGIYACCVLARFLMATLTSHFPTVYVDEFLYYSLGRSIATEGKLLYRGQSAVYNYIVYPLMLSPVYKLFPAGSNYYRIMQFWNMMIMSLSVFPLFSLCRSMLGDDKKALRLSALFMLLPDFILGKYILSEALIYPLFFTLLLLIYRSVKDGLSIQDGIGIGVLGGLLYQTKPGDVAPAAIALLYFLIRGIDKKSKKETLSAALGVAALGLVYLLFRWMANQVFSYSGSFFSIYDHQMRDFNGLFYDTFFRSLGLYPFYFILSCGVLPVLWGIARFSAFRKQDKHFYLLMLASLVVMFVGIAWLINRPEKSDILYLRYVAMFMPLSLMSCLLPARTDMAEQAAETLSWKKILALTVVAVYVAACTLIFGSQAGGTKYLDAPFMISMSVVLTRNSPGIAAIAFVLLCCLSLYLVLRGWDRKKMTAACVGVFLAVTVLNNCTGYYITGLNTSASRAEETMAIQRELKGENYLYVYADNVCDYGLDVNTNQNIDQVALYDFFNNIQQNGGVYVPFVPKTEKGMTAGTPLPDEGFMILDEYVHPLIKFSSGVQCTPSAKGNNLLVRYTPGTRIIDSIIGNVENLSLKKGYFGILTIYNQEWLASPVKVTLEIESKEDQSLSIYNVSQFSVPLYKGTNRYEITIEKPESGYNFSVSSSEILIHHFDITPAQ